MHWWNCACASGRCRGKRKSFKAESIVLLKIYHSVPLPKRSPSTASAAGKLPHGEHATSIWKLRLGFDPLLSRRLRHEAEGCAARRLLLAGFPDNARQAEIDSIGFDSAVDLLANARFGRRPDDFSQRG